MNHATSVNHEYPDDKSDRLLTAPDFPQFILADFDNPPVVETVLSLQFEKLSAMQSMHLGLFWRKMKDHYPKTEERPALPSVLESFPEPFPRGGRIQFEAVEATPVQRLWLLNQAETRIIQVQNDRFITNWRKAGLEDPYPHYEPVIKPAFERDFLEFQSFVAEEKLGTIKVNQCEVTYVNHIVSGEGWLELGEIHRIFAFWNQSPIQAPGRPEDFGLHIRFPITDDRNHAIGRLHVDVQPALRAIDNRPMYVMNLTARGQYGAGFDFFDVGRKWIVKSFEQLTTENMHQIWGKK
jgi:uncharacterized protein (TIGR04255 family)